jgi:hypothetical protein
MRDDLWMKGLVVEIIILLATVAIVIDVNAQFMESYANKKNIELKITETANKNPNDPPIIRNPLPEEGTTVDLTLNELVIFIGDPNGDRVNWTIETSPYIGNNWGVKDENGSKSCQVSNLKEAFTYHWYVNATDEHGASTNTIFTFKTEKIPIICNTIVWGLPNNQYHYLTTSLPKLMQINMSKGHIENNPYKVKITWNTINNKYATNMNLKFIYRIREWQTNVPNPFLQFFLDSGDIEPDVCPGAFSFKTINIHLTPYQNDSGEQLINLTIFQPEGTKIMGCFINHKFRIDWIECDLNFI